MSKIVYMPDYCYMYNGRYYQLWDSDTIARKEQFVSDFIAGIEDGQVALSDYNNLFRTVDSGDTPECYKEDIRYILALIQLSNIKPKVSSYVLDFDFVSMYTTMITEFDTFGDKNASNI